MRRHGQLDRRAFVALTGASALALGAGRALAATGKESPALAELVSAGKLPPLADRLPQAPLVIEPIKTVGKHGGALRRALRGDADHNSILRFVGNQGLIRWTPDYKGMAPNLAQSWEVSADATRYTFKLRPGTRWSDGHPFTADDILFWADDLLPDRAFYPAPPIAYVVAGDIPKVEKIDDHTVAFVFKAPYGQFLQQLATPLGQHPVLYAKHYAQKFHPKYNPDIKALLAEANVGAWPELFRLRCGDIETPSRWANVDRPTLDPWVIETPYRGGATEVAMRRNPYFWQVDTAGNQLPYIDRVRNRVISDLETILLTAVKGDLDFQVRHLYDNISNKPVLAERQAEGGYALQEVVQSDCQAMGFFFNQTFKDPKIGPLLRNKDFRVALSHGLDRAELIDIVWLGQGKPYQVGPLPETRLYNERLATQFLELDPAKANALLDRIGLSRKGGSGFRAMPDGSQLQIAIDVMLPHKAIIDALELVKRQWADNLGIDMSINTLERSIFYNRAQSNEHMIGMYPVPGGLDAELEPRAYVAIHSLDSRQSLEWAKWYTSAGKLGEEPEPSMKRRMELLDRWKTIPDQKAADAVFAEILDLAADAFEVIGVTVPPHGFGVRKKTLENVIALMPQGWSYATPGPALPQQFFFTDV